MNALSASPKALVLHSGGMDSTLCLLLARAQERLVVSLGIDYGQRHRIELEYAARQCERFGIERRLCHVQWQKPEGRLVPTNRSIEEMPKTVSPAFLPGRNIIFLALAVAEAVGTGATEVWIGVNSVDFSGYPDCRARFIDAFGEVVREGLPGGPKIVSPLQDLSKAEIARTAKRFGLVKQDTWSCYRPSVNSGILEPCRICDACILHDAAWQAVESPDVVSPPSDQTGCVKHRRPL